MATLKTLFAVTFIGLLALLASGLSMFVKMGTDNSQSETIGTITQLGFPIHYKYGAPGLAWAHFDGTRFWLNSAAWFIIVSSIWLALRYHNQKKQLA